MSELIELWHDLHGQSLEVSKSRLVKSHIVCRGLGDTIASQMTAKNFAHYRDQRLKGEIDNGYHSDPKKWIAKPVTDNREQNYLKAVFNELKRLGEWTLPNPLESIRAFKEAEKEMSWLTEPQIKELLKACDSYGKISLRRIVKICLVTGARWSEAERLTRSQLSPYKLTFTKTKGKKTEHYRSPDGYMMNWRHYRGECFTLVIKSSRKCLI